MKSETDATSNSENWPPDLLHTAGLTEDAPLDVLQQRMDTLANSAAPIARSWWMWMVLIQGISVAAPFLWLMRRSLGFAPTTAALVTLADVFLFVASLWWMCWRGMQRTWARARLMAEVVRSQMSASVNPEQLAHRILEVISAIQTLLAASCFRRIYPRNFAYTHLGIVQIKSSHASH